LAVCGFTYNPETFMAAKIGVYNISWRDMGVPTLDKMMDIVQVRAALNARHISGGAAYAVALNSSRSSNGSRCMLCAQAKALPTAGWGPFHR
jgi:hypothetical protein